MSKAAYLPLLATIVPASAILFGCGDTAKSATPVAGAPSTPQKFVEGTGTVHLHKADHGYQLIRNGQPYIIKGAGLQDSEGKPERALFLRLGGNSIRTWGADHLGAELDAAQKDGITVTGGIWLLHREEMDYHDAAKVAAQFAKCQEIVRKYKDHPALLMWAFGNEAEGDGKDPEVYKAIEALAAMAHKEDPNHPVMTVIAEIGENQQKLHDIQTYCPDLDLVGVNSYGGGVSLAQRYGQSGLQKPYVVTEFGPAGPWECEKTGWGAPVEQTSTDKAKAYEQTYRKNVDENRAMCLGSYTFLWGSKIEGTPTWFNMLLSDGSKLQAIDTITALWADKSPSTDVPKVEPIQLSGSSELAEGKTVRATLKASNADSVEWTLIRELGKTSEDPSKASKVEEFAGAVTPAKGPSVTVKLPGAGAYRLMAVARNAHGAATANVALNSTAPVHIDPNAPKGELPLTVYDETGTGGKFAPSGWMGDTNSIKMTPSCTDHPHSGRTCICFSFLNASNWGGIAWQYPANDWGSKPDSINLNGAKKLSFWMRGAAGGEKAKVEFGILGKDKTYPDSGSGSTTVVMTKDWKEYSIDLAGKDMTKIKTGFVVTVAGAGKPVTFYIDDVKYE